ncbi:MAG: ribosomal protein S18-alanine N-acetyltransferase [Deltaproteobacteria bacterium]|nr:ribosomal protein S18-alanine N-acetyltransferase [Deltaproteobacteria bacterium]
MIEVRPARIDDLEDVRRAELLGFPNPWQKSTYAEQIGYPRAVFLVAVRAGLFAGHALSWIVADEMHLLKIAVLPEERRAGVGRRLLSASESRCAAMGARSCFLEVRRSNDPARLFYEKMGYFGIGVRHGYYDDTGEDAIVLRKSLGDFVA